MIDNLLGILLMGGILLVIKLVAVGIEILIRKCKGLKALPDAEEKTENTEQQE